MRLSLIRIQNFRSFKDETIPINSYSCFVGPNGAGKSTVLNALNIFFRESKDCSVKPELEEEDFHCKNTDEPIKITVTFSDLSEEAKEELRDYVRQDVLIVSAIAEWSEATRSASVIQRGARLGIEEIAPFFAALGNNESVATLKQIYGGIRASIPSLPSPGTKNAMIAALRAYESSNSEKHVVLESSDEFYGATKGAHKLGRFIQWIFVPAIKDASGEQEESRNTALGQLVQRAVTSRSTLTEEIKELRRTTSEAYDRMLDEQQSALAALSESLKGRLTKWAHPEIDLTVKWDRHPERTVRVEEPYAKILAGECGFIGELNRLGHGLQRSFILALLEELAQVDGAGAPTLILGLEEPELFQHPPQAQHLAEVLQRLSEGNAQITVCSHSPYFIVGKGFEDVRLVRKHRGSAEAKVTHTDFDALSRLLTETLGEKKFEKPEGVRAKLHQMLQPGIREMFFATSIVLVEGLEDLAYITTSLLLSGKWERWRKGGGHLVPVNGKSEFIQPLAIARLMEIPTYIIFDADGDRQNDGRHKADNSRILKLLESQQPLFPETIIWQPNFAIWPSNLAASVELEYQPEEWNSWKNDVEAELGHPGGLEKNAIFIAHLLAKTWESGRPSKTLDTLTNALIFFCEAVK